MIQRLNELLASENNHLINQYTDEKFPIYFILAQPRGASTLFQQIITSNMHVGYISNFLAKFYKAPTFGLELEKDIIDPNFQSNFVSNYGNSQGLSEPHEWGWFWQDQLNLKGDEHYTKLESFPHLKQNLLSITNYKQQPLLIDNVYALSNLLKFKSEFNNIKLVVLTRDLYFICSSIINARLKRYDNINTFYGHKPHNYNELLEIKNPIEQIVLQVKTIQEEINAISNSFKNEDILTIDYETIFANTYDVVEEFHQFVQKSAITLPMKEKHLPKLNYRNNPKLINQEFKEELDFYFNKHIGKLS